MGHPFDHIKRCRKASFTVTHTDNNRKITELVPITEKYLKATKVIN